MLREALVNSIRRGARTHLIMPATFLPNRRTAVGAEAKAADEKAGVMRLPSPWVSLQPGDRLWVKEEMANMMDSKDHLASRQYYRAELRGGHVPIPGGAKGTRYSVTYTDARHMQRDESRFYLAVISARHFRARDMTWEIAKAEGGYYPAETMGAWWQRSYGFTMPWDENPEVVGIAFTFQDGNIDTGIKWGPDPKPPEKTPHAFGTRPIND
jgi:hypothetical protein